MNPSWVPIQPTNLRLPPSGGRTGARPLIKCALTSERPTLGANFKNPQSGKPDAAVGPDRVSPARWPPKPPLGARVRGTWAERVAGKVCAPRRAGTGVAAGAVAAEEAEGRRWHLAAACPPRPAAGVGHLESWGHFGRAASGALGRPPGQPFGEKIPAEVARLSPRAAPDPIWARRNSLDLECQTTPSGPASLPRSAPPPTRAPDRGVAAAGARGGQEQVGRRPGRPTKPRLLLTKAKSPAPAQGPAQPRRRQKSTPTTAAPSPSP